MKFQCNCEDCRARWVEDVVAYASFLEEKVIEIHGVLGSGPGSGKQARRMIRVLAGIAKQRALNGEVEAAELARDCRSAAEGREAGRLH